MPSDLKNVLAFLNTVNPIMSDLNKAGETVKKSFENNYMQKIHDAAKNEREIVNKKPSREIVMLRAFKNYASSDMVNRIDNVINTLTVLDTIKNIQSKMVMPEKPIIQSASKNDSDYSQNQLFTQLTGVIMALSLLKDISHV